MFFCLFVLHTRCSEESAGHLLAQPALSFPFIAEHCADYPVTVLCQTLEVTKSGYYARIRREPSQHCREDARLSAAIQQLFLEHRQVYGSPRLHALLKASGIPCSRKRVVRLMQQLGLSAQVKKRRKPTTTSDPAARFAPNRLGREFAASLPNQKWVTDTKAIATAEGWLYLAVILDLFSRLVVGWAMAATEDSDLVELALRMALATRRPEAWVAFATGGDPGWPQYDLKRRATMRFDIFSRLVDDPRSQERLLWVNRR